MVFRNYKYFVEIVNAGSLTKAAEKLYVSQPSLSQYVKRLESSLGVELFDRSTSPLQLTYTGERYYQYVQQVLHLDENVQKEFRDIQSQTSGRLRLGITLWRGANLLPEIFPVFHQRYPNIRLELTEGRSSQLEEALMNDRLDLAVMNLPRSLNYEKLTCEILCEERILLAAPTEHPYVQNLMSCCEYMDGYPVAPLELVAQIPLILTKPGQNLTYEIRYTLGKNHIEPDVLLETGNLSTAINLVSCGLACTFVPEGGAQRFQNPGNVTFFVPDSAILLWDLGVVYRKDIYIPQLARLFIDTAKERFGTGLNISRFHHNSITNVPDSRT